MSDKAKLADAQGPGAADLLFERARAIDVSGRNEAARDAYLRVLEVDPRHFEALTGLGALALQMGQRAAARSAFEQAARVHPEDTMAHGNLATVLFDDGDVAAARAHYEEALRLDPGNRNANRGLAILLLRAGQIEAARRYGRLGFHGDDDASPYRGTGQPIRLLLVMSAWGGNLSIDPFLDDRIFRKWVLVPEFFDPQTPLPPHDLVLNGIGDADRCAEALDTAAQALAGTNAPILNAPAFVKSTGRESNARRLGQLPGIRTARTVACPREALLAGEASHYLAQLGFDWPLLLRSPGFHTGQHFVKVEQPENLPGAVEALPGAKLLAIQFVDTRGQDGNFRKYRVMIVDGQLFPLHLAISKGWKVHYLSADMADHPEHRAEEELFLRDLPRALPPEIPPQLESVRKFLGLDYGGIDFGLNPQGQLVVFEANATMVLLPPGPDEKWRYRIGPFERVKQAVQRMLWTRAGRPPAETAS